MKFRHSIYDGMQLELTMAAASLIGAGVAAAGTGGQMILHGKSNKKTREWNERMYGIQRGHALEDWNRTNEYNSAQAQKERLKAAGLNPAMLYGQQGAGGVTAQEPRGADIKPWTPQIPDLQGMGLQMASMMSQIKVNEATANKLNAEAEKTKGVDTQEAQSRIVNNALESIIKKYTGLEAGEMFNEVKHPNRGIEAKTYEDEMSARQGLAGTVYDLWVNGKLEEKSLNEIESIALQNAKTRADTAKVYKETNLIEQNIKGAELSNIILELEKNLQTRTGIDRNSPGWLKILGRLFIGLTQ